MKKTELIEILNNMGYSEYTVQELLMGRRTPSLAKAVQIEKDHGIPPRYWINGIKDYLEDGHEKKRTRKKNSVEAVSA